MPEMRSDRVVELTPEGMVARARTFLDRPGRTMLGITGPPGAGKSTLTQALVEALGTNVVVVPMDGFHLANEVLLDMGRRDRKGAPDTYDVAGYVSLLRRIRDREDQIFAPRFDRELEESIGSALPVSSAVPLVVTEGNYLLSTEHGWADVRDTLDEVWYVDIDESEITRRLVERRVGHGHSPTAARDWVKQVDMPNAHTVIQTRESADLIMRLTEYSASDLDSPENDRRES